MLTLGAIVLAPAGAEETKKCGVSSPTHWAYCYTSTNEEMGKPSAQDASGTGGKAVMTGTIGGVAASFECSGSSLVAEFESGGKGGGTVTLSNCKETAPAHCRLSEEEENEIKMHFGASFTGKVEKSGKPEAVLSGTGGGEEIYDMELEHETSACQIPGGGYKITGKQTSEPLKAETSATEQELVISKSGSDFKIGGNEVTLSDTFKIKLTGTHGGASWYVGLGN
jgi:hypothetical protein